MFRIEKEKIIHLIDDSFNSILIQPITFILEPILRENYFYSCSANYHQFHIFYKNNINNLKK